MIDIEIIKKEYDEVLQQLADPELISDWPASTSASAKAATDKKATTGKEKFEELIKRKVYLEKIIEKEKELKELKEKIEENKSIMTDREDAELVSLAESEFSQFKEKEKLLEKELEQILSKSKESQSVSVPFPSQKNRGSSQAVIVEIRAGAGGNEASLFASDLFKMYSKYSQLQGWKQKILDSRPSEIGGFKEIIFEIKNGDVWFSMKWEAGVHRVQRIPKTEKTGRIHTSTASVAVLSKPKKGKITINHNDLKIDTYKASGPGGQYVNKRMTAVRITHLPTNLVVTSQNERNLQQNKENALSILEARLLEEKERKENMKITKERRSQIGKAQRAEKIRTYNFPQNRITDHRIKKSFHNLEEIMEGKLGPIIKALLG